MKNHVVRSRNLPIKNIFPIGGVCLNAFIMRQIFIYHVNKWFFTKV